MQESPLPKDENKTSNMDLTQLANLLKKNLINSEEAPQSEKQEAKVNTDHLKKAASELFKNQSALDMGSLLKIAGSLAGNKDILNSIKGMTGTASSSSSSEQANSQLEEKLDHLANEIVLLRDEIKQLREKKWFFF